MKVLTNLVQLLINENYFILRISVMKITIRYQAGGGVASHPINNMLLVRLAARHWLEEGLNVAFCRNGGSSLNLILYGYGKKLIFDTG